MSPSQCRAARALLGLEQDDLATRAGVNRTTLIDFERGERKPQTRTVAAIKAALEQAGVIFTPGNGIGPGVALAKPSTD